MEPGTNEQKAASNTTYLIVTYSASCQMTWKERQAILLFSPLFGVIIAISQAELNEKRPQWIDGSIVTNKAEDCYRRSEEASVECSCEYV